MVICMPQKLHHIVIYTTCKTPKNIESLLKC